MSRSVEIDLAAMSERLQCFTMIASKYQFGFFGLMASG